MSDVYYTLREVGSICAFRDYVDTDQAVVEETAKRLNDAENMRHHPGKMVEAVRITVEPLNTKPL